jgi:aldehyde:ferredoxin oxidoreductase
MSITSIQYEKIPVVRGYTDTLLRVDLTQMRISIEKISDYVRSMFVGGRGYCLNLVYEGTTEKTRFDSPENVLALAGGPFCGETGFAGTGKFIVGAISPLTSSFCDSNVGGYFFPQVKQSGFDAITLTGKTDGPVILFIDGEKEEIRLEKAPEKVFSLLDAEDYLNVWRGEDKPSSVSFISAGSGAKITSFGCINSVYYDVRRKRCRAKQAGRGGLGTVMADKGLWGVVVKYTMAKGLSNHPTDAKRLRKAGRQLRQVIQDMDPQQMRLGKQGTTTLLDMTNAHHLLPVHNYQFGQDDREKQVSGAIFEKQIFSQKTPDGCFPGCNLGCTKGCERHVLKTGPHKGKTVSVDGPEYETAAAITNLGVFDIDYMLEYAWYCDEYGIDTISTGVVAGFLFEAFERGFLSSQDTDGLELAWGSPETVMAFVHRLAAGKTGFARAAGKGIRTAKFWVAERVASRNGKSKEDVSAKLSRFAMECKGMEFSMYITKESLAQQGGYGFALKGPQHDEAWLIGIDQINQELPSFELKAEALRWFPLFRTWFNIVGLCKLPWIDVRHPDAKDSENPAKNFPSIDYYLELVNATLGTEKSLEDLLIESERCYLLHKLINLRQGYGTRIHDMIPLRAMAPVHLNEFESRRNYYLKYIQEVVGVITEGKSDAQLLEILQSFRKTQYDQLMNAVYTAKGYDHNGVPTEETLHRLGFNREDYLDIVQKAKKTIAGEPNVESAYTIET